MPWLRRRRNGFLVSWRDENRRERSRFFGDEQDAVAFLKEAEGQELAAKVLRGPGIPGWDDPDAIPEAVEDEYGFARYLRDFIEKDRNLRETTREQYLISLRTHIEGTLLGRADVRAIMPDDVQRFWDRLKIGNGALRNVQQLLSKGFNRAVRAGLIDVSPLHRTDIHRPSKRRATEIVPLTVSEIEQLADGAIQPRARMAILLMAYGGLRAGEVGGLRTQDVDFKRCQLRLRQQVVRTHRGMYVTDLKTDAARRTVPVPCSLAEELRAFVDANRAADDGRIFHSDGRLWSHQLIRKAVVTAAKRAGIRDVHPHVLRHTAVSLLIDDGANPKAIQVFVGHSNIQMTLDVYGHLFDYGGAALGESMERRREAHRNGS